MSNTLWAYATLGRAPGEELLRRLEARAAAVAESFNAQDVSNTLWSISSLGVLFSSSFSSVFSCRVLLLDSNAVIFSTSHMSQIHQWLLSLELETPSASNLSSVDVRSLRVWVESKSPRALLQDNTRMSALQQTVAETLQQIGTCVQQEAVDARSGYSIDCLVLGWQEHKNVKVAVEVDGPFHFIRKSGESQGRSANGATMMKRRHLGLLGYSVVPVPYWEWDELRGTQAKQAYLRGKLTAAVQGTPLDAA